MPINTSHFNIFNLLTFLVLKRDKNQYLYNLFGWFSLSQKDKPQIARVTASAARAPFHCEGGDNRNNIIVKLSEAALDNLDRIGYELVKKYRLAGYTQERIRMIALSHLLEAA